MRKELEEKFEEVWTVRIHNHIVDAMRMQDQYEAVKSFIDEYFVPKDEQITPLTPEDYPYLVEALEIIKQREKKTYTKEQVLEMIGEDKDSSNHTEYEGYNQAKQEIRNKLK